MTYGRLLSTDRLYSRAHRGSSPCISLIREQGQGVFTEVVAFSKVIDGTRLLDRILFYSKTVPPTCKLVLLRLELHLCTVLVRHPKRKLRF